MCHILQDVEDIDVDFRSEHITGWATGLILSLAISKRGIQEL